MMLLSCAACGTVDTPETTLAPETTEAPETTAAPETTLAPETTAEPETTAAPETTAEPETEAETEPAAPLYNANVVLSEEMQKKMSKYLPTKWPAVINQIMDNITDDFMFVVQSDTHYSVAKDDAKVGYNIAALSHYLPLSCFLQLGDYIKGYYAGEAGKAENTPELTMQSLKELTRRYLTDLNTKALITYGNHDANQLWCKYYGTADQQLTGADLYENVTSKMVEHNGEDMVTNGESNYYYVDFPYDGVRIIMLNTLDGNYENSFDDLQYISPEQLQWFKDVALDTDNTVIIGAHVPLHDDFPETSGSAPSLSPQIRAAVNEFVENGGVFVAYLYGHTHKQSDMVDEHGNLHISFTTGQHNAEVVMIDFEDRHITTVGLGSPVAREFDY